jgi:O-antigen/teichoic acid export membrane protein
MFNTSNSPSIALRSLRERVYQSISIVRLHPFDTTTTEGRSSERLRRMFWSATTSMLAKVINTLTILISVPITLNYLGTERYGLWMTITSVVAFLGFADLGIGNVILNLVSEANGKDDAESARVSISNAIAMLTGIAIFLSIIFALIYPRVNWTAFFNLSSAAAKNEAGTAMMVFVACFLVNLPLSIFPRIQMGYQEGYFSSLWQATSNLLGLGALIMAVQLRAGLPWLVLVITGFPVLGNFLNGISLFGLQRPWLLPKWRDLHSFVSKHIIQVGLFFLILQITNAITYSSDNIIIAQALGPEAVTNYAIPMRLFIIFPNIIYMFLSPLWPAYGEAGARGDEGWAKKTLIRSIIATFALSLGSAIMLVLFGRIILQVWTGSRVAFSLWLMIGMAMWMTLSTVLAAIAMFLNAINKIAFQTVFSIITAVFATFTKISLVGSLGLYGVIWGQIAVSILCMLIPYGIYLRARFSQC